ncbi:twin-arginine translocase TatA/TatE family subunit [Luteococcus sp. H138]|uniref:Sec-independent protein translocase subunit TatA/TatB n=1 Tax=unclassified Luteococcus TaxID=2639923 RepID=UPI00313D1972
MAGLGWQELLIVLVIAVLLFGGTRLAGVGKASGRAIREFKEETAGLKEVGKNGATAADASKTTAEAEIVDEANKRIN